MQKGDIFKVTQPMSWYCTHCDSVRIEVDTLLKVDEIYSGRINFSYLIDRSDVGHIHYFIRCALSSVEDHVEKFA